MTFRLPLAAAVFAAVALSSLSVMHQAGAQVILSSNTYAQNFDGMGSGTALPTGWRITESTQTTNYLSANTGVGGTATTLTGSSSGDAYSFRSGSDNAVGFLSSGGFATPRNLFVGLTNGLGNTITSLTLNFNYEKYRSGSRAFNFNFSYSENGTSWTPLAAGNQAYAADAANTTVSFPPLVVNKSGIQLTGLDITAGETIYFRWEYVGTGGSSNGQALAVDNFSLSATVVPEPGSTLLLGVAAISLAVMRRRRSRTLR